MKYYDKDNKRLVYTGSPADERYWNQHWNSNNFKKAIQRNFDPFVTGHTKKYIKKGGRILEGGCGIGQNVYLLNKHGYDVVGIDYAQKTVDKINTYAPELNVRFGDVRSLVFEDDFFDGYWSFGVIEHFYNGYDNIMLEMHRVLKQKGVLLMTVPTMSLLRKLKVKKGLYPQWIEESSQIEQFYQFSLDSTSIIEKFECNGFELIIAKPISGFKGLKDEVSYLRKPMQFLFDSQFLLFRVVKKIVDKLTQRFSGHMTLFIFRKI